jgi:hypothetical protein
VSGWGAPNTPGPIVGWEVPAEPEGLGVRESIGAGWRILRANLRTLAATAAVPEIVRNLMVIPTILIVARAWQAMIDLFTTINWSNYVDDQVNFQQQMQDAFTPPTDLAILSGVASGASIGLALFGLSVVTAATLAAVDGRRPTVGGAYRDVIAHAGALIVPAVVLGLGWALIGTPLALSQGSIAFSDASSLRTQAAVGAVLGLVGLIVTVAAIVLGVRWSLAIPAILAEDLTLRRGLSRSAELTSGIRVRIFIIFLVLGLVVGLLFSAIAFVTALVVGVATLSLVGGIAAYLVVSTIGGFFWLPMGAAVLSHVYRVRAGPVGVVAADGPLEPPALGEAVAEPPVVEPPVVDGPAPSA